MILHQIPAVVERDGSSECGHFVVVRFADEELPLLLWQCKQGSHWRIGCYMISQSMIKQHSQFKGAQQHVALQTEHEHHLRQDFYIPVGTLVQFYSYKDDVRTRKHLLHKYWCEPSMMWDAVIWYGKQLLDPRSEDVSTASARCLSRKLFM